MENTDYYDHPVFDPLGLQLETPETTRLENQLLQWLWTGSTGAYVTGESRTGKTTALEMLSQRLVLRNGNPVPVHLISFPPGDASTIASVFRNLCLSAELKCSPRDQGDTLKKRFFDFLLDKASIQEVNRLVLLVDEMQRLSARQINAFAHLYDLLRKAEISLMTVFIGNSPDCKDLIEEINKPENAHLYGRFFTQSTQFSGLRSAKDVGNCLKQYDKLRYPLNTGPTYTEYFLAKEVRKGWKLGNLTHQLWGVFREYQKDYRLESWGMQYFTSTVNTLLVDFLPSLDVNDIDDGKKFFVNRKTNRFQGCSLYLSSQPIRVLQVGIALKVFCVLLFCF